MTDIVERLRAQSADILNEEAAAEIERLRAERDDLIHEQIASTEWQNRYQRAKSQRDEARAERDHYGSTADARAVCIKMLERERDRLREALLIADAACRSYWGWEYGRPGDVDDDDVPDSSLLKKWRRDYEARAALGEDRDD